MDTNDLNKNTYFNYYKIEKGDTLYKIARMYNINPLLLASLNGLNMEDYIYPDQVLLIPNDNKIIYLLEGKMIVKKKN